jgi:hypothetical protein
LSGSQPDPFVHTVADIQALLSDDRLVMMETLDGIIRLTLTGDADTAHFPSLFAQAASLGWLGVNTRILVDFSAFSGSIDWGAIREVQRMPVWGRPEERRTAAAYVVRNRMFLALIKVSSLIFSSTQHRAFDNRIEALLWLEGFPPRGKGS